MGIEGSVLQNQIFCKSKTSQEKSTFFKNKRIKMSVTKWHRPIFSGPSPQSTIINSGNGTNDNQRKTLKGDLVWDLRVGRMEQWGVCVLHPKEKGHPDMSCLFSKPSNRKHPNYTYPSPNSNGSSSDNIKQALPHHQQRRLIESPTRNKCRERLSLLLTSLRLPVSTYKITNQDESRNSRKNPAIASSLIQKACYSLGGSKFSSSAKRHQSKVAKEAHLYGNSTYSFLLARQHSFQTVSAESSRSHNITR